MTRPIRLSVPRIAPLAVVAVAATLALTAPAAVSAASPGSATRPTAAASKPAYGTIWVVDSDSETGNAVTEYAPGAQGNVAPVGRIAGSHTQMDGPNAIAATDTGALWVAQTSGNQITQYAAGARGNVKPTRVIAGANTGINSPIAIALGRDGSLWVMNNESAALLHFGKNASGNVAPLTTVTGAATGIKNESMRGIAVTPNGKHVWAEYAGGTVDASKLLQFSSTSDGNATPTKNITGDKSGLCEYPYGITVNAANELIVGCDNNPNAILTYAANATGNVPPLRSIAGPSTKVTSPSFLDLDALGNIWFENYPDNNVVAARPNAHGNVAPLRLIAGSKTKLDGPNAVAVFSAAPTAPRKLEASKGHQHQVTLRWHRPHSDGGGILGYAAYLKASHHGWKAIGTTSKRTLTIKRKLKSSDRFAVTAVNADGKSPKSGSVKAR
jgi:hypothetical protein